MEIRWGWDCSSIPAAAPRRSPGTCPGRSSLTGGTSRSAADRLARAARAAMRRRCSRASTSSLRRTTTRWHAGSAARIRWMRRFRCSRRTRSKTGVPDRGFPWVSPAQGGRMTAAWARLMAGSEAMSHARLLHLHHLTPIHDAVARVFPGVPVLTHLHGTELKMLDALSRDPPSANEGPHARWWVSRARAVGPPSRGHDHALSLRARRGGASAGARSGDRALPAERCRRGAVHVVPPDRR